mgnify:FL=1
MARRGGTKIETKIRRQKRLLKTRKSIPKRIIQIDNIANNVEHIFQHRPGNNTQIKRFLTGG